ncbi:squalene/phytoene synthase family protein [Phormidium sp. CLA17]|uniref:squalene/phytoene synthase family protein n=1 Tax=Leptolyngbya sp. Cla-17 TaxID=2803751 RepID=UPI001490FA74|nr:squalene/phytoene synthase family protein [Leptolyngbya sp. Cla-17]MBM0742444.1 squalene/phytoene synthase family protein [Leptolyngbya sp. Cla-17]
MKHTTALRNPRAESINLHEGIIASLVGSSNYDAISDDALKDEDNAGWVMELDLPVRAQWIERIRWIRLIDRFAEHELLCKGQPALQSFLMGWQHLASTGKVKSDCVYDELLTNMQLCWFNQVDQLSIPRSLTAWKRYVRAIAQYHTNHLAIHTMADYEQMLMDLGGSFFQVLPFLSETHHQAASYFGMLDQFYNHLRDLHEDAKQGICNLPSELLDGFGVSRDEILQQQAIKNPAYHKMMQFWLEEYLPKLRRRARQLLTTENLHPSWQLLCDWSIHRYRRIDQVFRDCQFNYTQFPQVYWQQVHADLPMMLNHVRHHRAQSLPLKFFSPAPAQSTYIQLVRLEKAGSCAA